MPGQPGAVAVDLLRSAARAIHAERDHDRLLAWVANSLAAATGAALTGLAVDVDTHPRRWVTADNSVRNLAVVGDPYSLPQLAPILRGESDGLFDDEHLRRLLSLQSVSVLPIPASGPASPGGHQPGNSVHGIVVLGFLPNELPSRESLRTAETLIEHLGVALDNQLAMADLETAQRGILHKLQEAVRPPTPAVPQTELGVFYLAADQQASMGGDLYDWVLLPDGSLHLAVVDVMGKGVSATKDAVAVTHALRLLVLDGVPLERVITRADALVTAQNPELVATLMIGRYDSANGILELAGGGHPPLLVVSGTEPRWIEAGGIPIGFPTPGPMAW